MVNAAKILASIINRLNLSNWVAFTSIEWDRCPIFKIITIVILVYSEEVDVPGACEEDIGAEVPEGPEARVGKYASTCIKYISTSGDVST